MSVLLNFGAAPSHAARAQSYAAPDYSRQVALPEVGAAGQQRLRAGSVLVIGAAGKTGRAVVALARDPQVARWNSQALSSGQLARVYGFTDLDGKLHEEEAEGLFATCIQHEIDHLNGVLFVDYLSKLKRDRVMKKFTKAAKRATG